MRTVIVGGFTGLVITLVMGYGLGNWQWWVIFVLCIVSRFEAVSAERKLAQRRGLIE